MLHGYSFGQAMVRIFKYPWHIGHDYELFKLPYQWSLLTDTSRSWAVRQRPLPSPVRQITSSQLDGQDLMILHVDQWIFDEIEKRSLFEYWRDHFPGVKIVINHGCNMVDGCSSERMRDYLGDLPVVCNSPTANELWGLANSRFILHGFSPEQWPQTDYADPRVVVIQSHQKGRHSAFRNHDAVKRIESYGIKLCWVGRDVRLNSFDQYREFLSHASIYLNVAAASPNPRTRAEAMLCGLAVVTTVSHGEHVYLENGVNGFGSNSMEELIDYLRELSADPALVQRLGRAGRKTAQEVFHIDRFKRDWQQLIGETLV